MGGEGGREGITGRREARDWEVHRGMDEREGQLHEQVTSQGKGQQEGRPRTSPRQTTKIQVLEHKRMGTNKDEGSTQLLSGVMWPVRDF